MQRTPTLSDSAQRLVFFVVQWWIAKKCWGAALPYPNLRLLRDEYGINDSADKCSAAYTAGQFAAIIPGMLDGEGEAEATAWVFGSFKSDAKWANQMAQRGWTPELITNAIENGEQFAAENLVNGGNQATRYVSPITQQSVVMDNITNEIIHIGGPGFKY